MPVGNLGTAVTSVRAHHENLHSIVIVIISESIELPSSSTESIVMAHPADSLDRSRLDES